ncbi:MAG TPA: ABC-2 family transporter protein [Chloroflexota bacterium]|nr:ABC-2 family transporter protein [Chloroflexota bacterium]
MTALTSPVSVLLLHVRLWRQFVLTDAMLLVEYRASFVFGVARQVASLALTVFGFGLLYQYTDEIAGWSRAELLVLLGVFWIFNALWDLLLDGLTRLSNDVRHGTLDFILLRPVSAQFLISLRQVGLLEILNVLLGIGLVAYAGNLAGIEWSVGGVALATLLGLSGLVGIYALRFMIVTCAIWLVSVQNLHDILHPVFQMGQYPVTFFKGWVRLVLTFVVPVAFATTFPAQALLGTLDLRLIPVAPAVAAATLYASHRFWHFALRHYTSATS